MASKSNDKTIKGTLNANSDDFIQSTITTSSGGTITTNNTSGYVTYDFNDYSLEKAVMASNMDDVTKIKIIQALKKPGFAGIYYDSVPKINPTPDWTISTTGSDPTKYKPSTTCGENFRHFVDYNDLPQYSVNHYNVR